MPLNHSGQGVFFVGWIVAVILAATGCQQAPVAPQVQATPAAADHAAMVKRGEYLVAVGACNDCHTPLKMGANGPEPDTSRMLSGHPERSSLPPPPKLSAGWGSAGSADNTAWAGPWGISYTANLTPDENTGIGIWDEQMFIKAIRNGRHMGEGRPLLPPMPWRWYAKMTDEDLKAIFVYLKSIPAISNHVPEPVIATAP